MNTKKRIKKIKFVPSTGDEGYMLQGKLTALSLKKLDDFAIAINIVIERVQKSAAEGQLEIGNYLLKARKLFPGDKEFGNWRAENTEIKSMQVASNLMAVARKFSTAPKMIKACSYSALVELVSAPAALIKEIEESIESGIPAPTSAVIRADKKELAIPVPVGKTSKSTKTIYDKEPEPDADDEASNLIHSDLFSRLNHSNPYVHLGLYPFGGPPNYAVIDAIELWYEAQENDGTITEDQMAVIYLSAAAIRRELK